MLKIMGQAAATVEQMQSYIKMVNPKVSDSVIKMIPLTGVTMPFLSYGGSSLLSCMAMIGILHGASARAQENLEEDILCVRG